MEDDRSQDGMAARLSARLGSLCFGCGSENPRGLRLQFEKGERGEMIAAWTPDESLQGFAGIIHGGLVSTVLDESMSKAVTAAGAEALTAELRVRFRKHVVAGSALRVSGWVTENHKHMLKAESTLIDAAGAELAHGWASFVVLK